MILVVFFCFFVWIFLILKVIIKVVIIIVILVIVKVFLKLNKFVIVLLIKGLNSILVMFLSCKVLRIFLVLLWGVCCVIKVLLMLIKLVIIFMKICKISK